MYQLELTKEKYRENPWSKPYKDRIEILKNAKKKNRKSVAFLYPHFDSSTFRYRGYNIAETMEYSYHWSGSYFELGELHKLLKELSYIDVLVMIRCAWEPDLEEFIIKAKNKGIKLCYDVDDLIYNPDHMPSVIEALGLDKELEWNYWFGLTRRNYIIANLCDALITTNGFLANYLKQDFDRPCYVIKNYLNWMQEDVSCEYFVQKQKSISKKPFIIGYFSGSPTHLRDLMMIMPELEEFLNKHENTKFRIVGYMDLPIAYNYLVESGKIEFIPFQTMMGLQYEQAKVDVNVVPLVNNEFSNCKSELKYFESAIVGTITCATPSYTYSNAIINGDNGYLCKEKGWLPVFENLYINGIGKEQQKHIRERALEEYSYKNQIKLVESVFEDILRLKVG